MHIHSSLVRFALTAATLAAMCALPGGVPTVAAQTPASTYTWYGQVASVDAASKTATFVVQAQPQVLGYAADYKPGDKLVLVWAPLSNEADRLVYVAKAEAMAGVDLGYLLRADFVSVDKAAGTLTVKAPVPDATALQGVTGWVKATMPKDQANGKTTPTLIARSAKPDLKPPVSTAPKLAAANPDGPLANIGGTWELEASLAGNAITNACTVAQDGTKISGSCKSALGVAPIAGGEVAGNTVKFHLAANFGGMALDFAYAGTLEPDGKSMNGVITIFGMDTGFSGVKK